MRDFYERYYAAMAHSQAHARFCERVFGQNLCQHSFADMKQIEALITTTGLGPGDRALDLGCGNGMITEYLADRTGAHITGLDYIPHAIRQAQARTAAKTDRLVFIVGNINALELPVQAFDVVFSIDTLYFSDDYATTIHKLMEALQPAGQMAILFSHGREPWVPIAEFAAETLAFDKTPLAMALRANGLAFDIREFTEDDYRLAKLRQQVLEELKPEFAAEDIMFIYENRLGDANGIRQACEEGLQRRYLYHIQLP